MLRKCQKQTIQKLFSVAVKPILFTGIGNFGVKNERNENSRHAFHQSPAQERG
jgi:hypothetical protein